MPPYLHPCPQTKLDEANEVRANLEHLVEEQEEQIERLRRRAKRRDEEITQVSVIRFKLACTVITCSCNPLQLFG